MEKDSLFKLLYKFLNTLEDKKSLFNAKLKEEEKKEIAADFQYKVIQILDYIYTNFPTDRKSLGIYYPRPDLSETEKTYLNRIKTFRKKGETISHPKIILDFLKKCFYINEKHNKAISYLKPAVKHEVPNDFGQTFGPIVKGDFFSSNSELIKKKTNGDIEIAGVIQLEKGGIFKMNNSVISSPEGFIAGNLEAFTGEIFEGDLIFLKNDEKRKFCEWAD